MEIIKVEENVAPIFDKYFVNVLPKVCITNNYNFLSNTDTSDDPLERL